MNANKRAGNAWAFAATATLLSGLISPAAAQVGSLGGLTGPALTPPPVITSDRVDPFAQPGREYTALPLGPWLVYPTIFLGAIFDDNVRQTEVARVSSGGARLVPSLLAETTDGIYKTTLYGMADGRLYTDDRAENANALAARAGFIERFQPMPDAVFNFQGDYTRQRDLFSTFGIDHSVTSLNPTGIGLSPVTNPIAYNQFSATASMQKSFGRAFFSVGGSVVDIQYDTPGIDVAPSPDGIVFTGTSRLGFWFTPFLYAYGEGTIDQRNYSDQLFNSSGYRTLAGIGSDQIGLFRGEVYGGYQSEHRDFVLFDNVNSGVFGGRIYYYPLRELTLAASVDESLGVTFLASAVPGTLGTPTKVTTALFQATYGLAREWSASARFGYIHTDYVDTIRVDNAWTAGATVAYSVWQNFAVTLDYQYVQLDSNVPLQSFTRNVVTLGATYRY